jgi:beta-1,4-mannosyl-glycoprotein beta-1,4-N-acetylglucosaminyltransferase
MTQKIFDCFPFFNEVELLELRLMELANTVDYFVIAEANRTHTGNPKEFNFEKNKNKFKKYLDKIIYVKVADLPKPTLENPWVAENFQRNALVRGYEGVAQKGDVILISDADEIPKPEAIKANLKCNARVIFKQLLYYYYVNCNVKRNWGGTVLDIYGRFPDPQNLRNSTKRHSYGVFPNGGWHYSYLTGNNTKRLIYKGHNIVDHLLKHTVLGNPNDVSTKLKNLKDPYGRLSGRYQMRVVDISRDKPKSMDTFLKKYPQFYYNLGKETLKK